MTPTQTHFRPHADWMAEVEAWTAAMEAARAKPRKLYIGDRVIIKATGWDGIVDYISGNDVCVKLDNGPDRGLRTFAVDELEFWSHGQ